MCLAGTLAGFGATPGTIDLMKKPDAEIALKPPETVQRDAAGCIVFTGAQPEASAFFNNIPTPERQVSYLAQVGLTGDPGVRVFTYIENSSNGWQNGGAHIACSGRPEVSQYLFSPQEEIKGPSYLGVIMKSEGNLKINSAKVIRLEKNTIPGADFEQNADCWILNPQAEIVEADNSHWLELSSPSDDAVGEAMSPLIVVEPGTYYELTYEVTGVERPWNQLLQDSKVIPLRDGMSMGADDAWVQCLMGRQTKTLKFKTGATQTSMQLQVVVKAPGCVRFDNFVLKESAPEVIPAEIVLDMPFQHGDGVFASNATAKITGEIRVNVPEAARLSLALTDAAQKTVWSDEQDCRSGATAFAVPAPAEGAQNLLTVTLKDAAGKTLYTTSKELHHYAPRANEVTFREDGVTLVDGKPFFMIAHWWFTRRGDTGGNVDWWYENDLDVGDDMDFLREAGFNTILIRTPRHVEIAEEHGLKAIIEFPHTLPAGTPEEKEAFRRNYIVENHKFSSNPALFAYLGPDEVMLRGIPASQALEGSELVREADPYHPIFYNEAPCGTAEAQKEYAPIGDVIGRDIYPVGAPHGDMFSDRSMTAVGKHTDICHESVEYRKPVWMILQALGWAHFQAGNNTKPAAEVPGLEYPTYEQNRFMAYNAILHGATGILYHYLGYTVHVPDEYWDSLRRVILEMVYLSDVYTAPTVTAPALQCAQPEIRFLVKHHDGRNYYLVANESDQVVKAEFTGCPEKQLYVLFGAEPVAVNDGRFTIEFQPYEVRVMAETPFKSADEIFKMDSYTRYSDQPVLRGKQ